MEVSQWYLLSDGPGTGLLLGIRTGPYQVSCRSPGLGVTLGSLVQVEHALCPGRIGGMWAEIPGQGSGQNKGRPRKPSTPTSQGLRDRAR